MNPKVTLIRSKTKERKINDNSTQFVCNEFDDYIFIVITQNAKIGTLVSVKPVLKSDGTPSPWFIHEVLLGKEDPKAVEIAKDMAQFAVREAGKIPVLLGLSLKDTAKESIEILKGHLKDLLVWLKK